MKQCKLIRTKSTMTKSSCGPDPSELCEWRLVWRGDGQGGESGGWIYKHTHTPTLLGDKAVFSWATWWQVSQWSSPWGPSPTSRSFEAQTQRRAGLEWLLGPTRTQCFLVRSLLSCSVHLVNLWSVSVLAPVQQHPAGCSLFTNSAEVDIPVCWVYSWRRSSSCWRH